MDQESEIFEINKSLLINYLMIYSKLEQDTHILGGINNILQILDPSKIQDEYYQSDTFFLNLLVSMNCSIDIFNCDDLRNMAQDLYNSQFAIVIQGGDDSHYIKLFDSNEQLIQGKIKTAIQKGTRFIGFGAGCQLASKEQMHLQSTSITFPKQIGNFSTQVQFDSSPIISQIFQTFSIDKNYRIPITVRNPPQLKISHTKSSVIKHPPLVIMRYAEDILDENNKYEVFDFPACMISKQGRGLVLTSSFYFDLKDKKLVKNLLTFLFDAKKPPIIIKNEIRKLDTAHPQFFNLTSNILITGPHTMTVNRYDCNKKEIIEKHKLELKVAEIILKLSYEMLKIRNTLPESNNKSNLSNIASFGVWDPRAPFLPDILDPNYLWQSQFQDSVFHRLIHQFANKFHSQPLLHVDLHGKADRNTEDQHTIEIGIKSWCEQKASNKKNNEGQQKSFKSIVDKQLGDVFLNIDIGGKKVKCTSSGKLTGQSGGGEDNQQTMTHQAISIGIPSLQIELPLSIRKELYANDKLINEFANAIFKIYENGVVPYQQRYGIDKYISNKIINVKNVNDKILNFTKSELEQLINYQQSKSVEIL